MEIEISKGWIKLPRNLIQSHIWLLSTPEQKTVLITLLTMVNYTDNEWEFEGKKYICRPGQVITSLESIKQRCGKGISIQNVRTAINRFEKLGFLTNQSTNQNRLITICNWGDFSGSIPKANSPSNNGLAVNTHTANSQITATKKNNNDKEKKEDSVFILPSNAFDHFNR